MHIPSWRLDVEREIDVIEEIARLYGYDKFENTLPAYSGAVVELPQATIDATLRGRALALGYNEAVSLTFISHSDAEKFSSAKVLELENPLSEEASVMRTSLVPGMLDMLAWNLNRDVAEARLFEIGNVYELAGETGGTEAGLFGRDGGGSARFVAGGRRARCKQGRTCGGDGNVSRIQGRCGESAGTVRGELSYDRETAEYFHPGRSARARVNGAVVAQFGQIHPEVAAARKLRQDVYLAEFDLEQLYKLGCGR